MVTAFYDKVLDSSLIAHHFEDVVMEQLIEHQTRFISFLMGGPARFTDEHLRRVHQRHAISLPEFDEMVRLLTETLADHEFEARDVAMISHELRRREPVIVSAR